MAQIFKWKPERTTLMGLTMAQPMHYALEYNFKPGFSYTIAVDLAYTSTPTTQLPKITLSLRTTLPSPSDTRPTVCGPVSGSYYLSSIGNIVGDISPTSTNLTTYSTGSFSFPSTRNYLVITAGNGASQGSVVKIAKILITESAPAPSVSLTSSTSSIQCGAATTVTLSLIHI